MSGISAEELSTVLSGAKRGARLSVLWRYKDDDGEGDIWWRGGEVLVEYVPAVGSLLVRWPAGMPEFFPPEGGKFNFPDGEFERCVALKVVVRQPRQPVDTPTPLATPAKRPRANTTPLPPLPPLPPPPQPAYHGTTLTERQLRVDAGLEPPMAGDTEAIDAAAAWTNQRYTDDSASASVFVSSDDEQPPSRGRRRAYDDSRRGQQYSGWAEQDSLSLSHALLDQAHGVKTPMISLAPGLRIPQHVEARWSFLYPNMWVGQGARFREAIVFQHVALGCTFRSFAFKELHDLDLEIMVELLNHKKDRQEKEHWKVLFHLAARIASALLHTSSLGGAAGAESYTVAFGKSFAEGRLDLASSFFALLQKGGTPTPAETAARPPTPQVDYDRINTMVTAAVQKQTEVKGGLRSERPPHQYAREYPRDRPQQGGRGRMIFRRPWRGRN